MTKHQAPNSCTSTVGTHITSANGCESFIAGDKMWSFNTIRRETAGVSCFCLIMVPPQVVVWVTADTPSAPTRARAVGSGMGRPEARVSSAKNDSNLMPTHGILPNTPVWSWRKRALTAITNGLPLTASCLKPTQVSMWEILVLLS